MIVKWSNEQIVAIYKVLLHAGNHLANPHASNLQFSVITFKIIDTL